MTAAKTKDPFERARAQAEKRRKKLLAEIERCQSDHFDGGTGTCYGCRNFWTCRKVKEYEKTRVNITPG